jgi:hypothetical protein
VCVRARVYLFVYTDYALLCLGIVCWIPIVAVSGAGDCSLFNPFREIKARICGREWGNGGNRSRGHWGREGQGKCKGRYAFPLSIIDLILVY